MKKVSLFLTFLSLTVLGNAQDNLIKDGKFENVSFNVNDTYRTIPSKGIWYPYLTSNRLGVYSTSEDKERGSVLSFQSLTDPSYAYGYVGQRIDSDLEPGVYRVGFWAKSITADPLPVINIYIRVNTSPKRFLFFKLNDFDPKLNSNRSGALWQRRLTNDWAYYTIDFDLSKTIDNAANYKISTEKGNKINIENSTKSDLRDLYIGISNTMRNTHFYITDVSLIKLNEK